MRDGASSVAAGTPKKGTKAASAQAEVHVGQVEEGVPALDGAHQRLGAVVRARRSRRWPKRSRPRRIAASNTGLLCAW